MTSLDFGRLGEWQKNMEREKDMKFQQEKTYLIRTVLTIFLSLLILTPVFIETAFADEPSIKEMTESISEIKSLNTKSGILYKIENLDKEIENLIKENEKLQAKQESLNNEIPNKEKSVEKTGKMRNDPVLMGTSIFFLFAIGGFISSIVFLNKVWGYKWRGKKE